jgi:N-glycosylase/DNA lyase
METGAIPIAEIAGGVDLYTTVESGQTYAWRRADGRCYDGDDWVAQGCDPGPWYHTVVPTSGGAVARREPDGHDVVRVRRAGDELQWESTTDGERLLRELLALDHDLAAIAAAAPEDPVIADAFAHGRDLRIVADPPFACTVSFICSAQMRVGRIHGMVTAMAREFGPTVEMGGETYHGVPTPEGLADATEAELRDLGLGYRAPYVRDTAAMVADGEAHPADAAAMAYPEAREELTRFVGVGQKVADCVCLFSLGHLQAVPLDTWIHTAIADHFPGCDRGNYDDTSRAIRERLGADPDAAATAVGGEVGGEVGGADALAGYVQTYLFHYLRTEDVAPTA